MSRTNSPLVQHLADRLAGFRLDHLELLVAAACAGRSVILLGRHGLGKTVLVSLIFAMCRFSSRVYCGAKDDLVTGIAGIPSPVALAEGRLEWAAHARTLWSIDGREVEACFIDEINRAPRGENGIYLEVVENRSLFGIKLPLKTIWAAANDDVDSYETNRIDAALLDRFDVVFPVPQPGRSSLDVLTQVALVNLRGAYKVTSAEENLPDARPFLQEYRCTRERLLEDVELCTAVGQWAARLVHEIQRHRRETANEIPHHDELYISFRALARLPNVVLDLFAFQMAAYGLQRMLTKLVESAELCSELSLATKSSIPIEDLCRAQTAARDVLRSLAETRLREFDRLRPLSHGTLKSRILALEWLNLGQPAASETQRLTMLVGQLVHEVSTFLEQGAAPQKVPVGRLWHNLEKYPEHRHELELSILRHRLTTSQKGPAETTTSTTNLVAANGRWELSADSDAWAPWNFEERGEL